MVSDTTPVRRLYCDTYAAHVQGHDLAITVARDGVDGAPVEVVFVGRGKIGQGLDLLLSDLGIAISRAIQRRDPDTGGAL